MSGFESQRILGVYDIGYYEMLIIITDFDTSKQSRCV